LELISKVKLLIHDLPDELFSTLSLPEDGMTVIAANGKFAPCQGCFACWLKTPGHCFIKDELQHIGALFGKSDEVIIISENWYGGYSAAVKRVLDRSISTSLPFFTYRGGSLHHRRRYKNEWRLKVILYGDFSDAEKETAHAIVEANRSNLGCRSASLFITNKPENVGGFLQ